MLACINTHLLLGILGSCELSRFCLKWPDEEAVDVDDAYLGDDDSSIDNNPEELAVLTDLDASQASSSSCGRSEDCCQP